MANNDNNVFSLANFSASLNEGGSADHVDILKGLNEIRVLTQQRYDALQYLYTSPIVKKRIEVLTEIQIDLLSWRRLKKRQIYRLMCTIAEAHFCSSEHDELKAKFFEERAALEAKYQLLYQPLYTKRYEIVNGLAEVEGLAMETAAETSKAGEKGVPSFWLIALKNNDVLAEEITERDSKALEYLKDIKYTRITEPQGFILEFFFDSNPYFSNTVLTKTYHMVDKEEPILENAIGTEIDWFPGKCLTEKILENKTNKESNTTILITKTKKGDSFFNFFNPPEIPVDDLDLYEEVVEELQNDMEQDYEIGSTIRDKIIPHAVSWYTKEAADGECGDLDDDDDDDDDVDNNLDDDNEDENDPKKKNVVEVIDN